MKLLIKNVSIHVNKATNKNVLIYNINEATNENVLM